VLPQAADDVISRSRSYIFETHMPA